MVTTRALGISEGEVQGSEKKPYFAALILFMIKTHLTTEELSNLAATLIFAIDAIKIHKGVN
jgi:hypothetical protein